MLFPRYSMKKICFFSFIFVITAGAAGFLHPIIIDAQTESDNYIIWADVFSAGGTEGTDSSNYSLSDTIGEGVILSATSTSASYGIKAGFRELYTNQFLTLEVGATSVSLGTLSASAASTGSHTMTLDTNAGTGYSVTVSGSTLTSGANTISAIGGTAAASSAGTEQFGINLVANTSPSVGAAPSGSAPIGSAAGQYAIADSFAYATGNTVATSNQDVNATVFTISYLVNIASNTDDGTYSTTLTYSTTVNP
jgi:hypothetical protein